MIKDLKNVNLLVHFENESFHTFPIDDWRSEFYYVQPFSIWKKRRKRKPRTTKKYLLHKKFVYWINYFYKISLQRFFKNNFYNSFYLGSFIFTLSLKKYLYFKKVVFLDFLKDLDINFLFLSTSLLKNITYYNKGMYYLYTNKMFSDTFFDKIEDFFFDSPQKTIKLIDLIDDQIEYDLNIFVFCWIHYMHIYIEFYKLNLFLILIKNKYT